MPDAKHNGCREADPEAYVARIAELSRTVRTAASVAGPSPSFPHVACVAASLWPTSSRSAELASEVASPVAG